MADVIWKPVPDYEGLYEVSNAGEVRRVAHQIVIDNPNNLPQVNHIDENKTNNHVSNLEWCTNQYNSSYGTRGKRIGAANTNGKKSLPIVTKCGNDVLRFPSIAEASRATGVCRENIIAVLKNRRNIAGGYKWEYLF